MNLLTTFKTYLKTSKDVNEITVKNYLVDIRHLFSWLTFKLAAENKISLATKSILENLEEKIKFLTPRLLEEYKTYLLANNIAKSTINRRLASVRIFCQFCQNNGLLEQNPGENLTNLPVFKTAEKKIQDLVSKFGSWLKDQRISKNTIKNYTADVRRYLLDQLVQQ